MRDKGFCFCFPSFCAIIPGWAIAVLFFMISWITNIWFILLSMLNFTPHILSAINKDKVWARVLFMVHYVIVSLVIAFLLYYLNVKNG